MGKSSGKRDRDRVRDRDRERARSTHHHTGGSGTGSSANLRPRARSKTRSDRPNLLIEDPSVSEKVLAAQLKTMGLYAAHTVGDGNCLFRAVSDQAFGDPSRHLELRHLCCEFIAHRPDRFRLFVDEDSVPGGFEGHVKSMRLQGTYGTHIELSALASLLRTSIKVIQPGLVYVIECDDPSSTTDEGEGAGNDEGVDENNEEEDGKLANTTTGDTKTTRARANSKNSLSTPNVNNKRPLCIIYHAWEHYSSARPVSPLSPIPLPLPMPTDASIINPSPIRVPIAVSKEAEIDDVSPPTPSPTPPLPLPVKRARGRPRRPATTSTRQEKKGEQPAVAQIEVAPPTPPLGGGALGSPLSKTAQSTTIESTTGTTSSPTTTSSMSFQLSEMDRMRLRAPSPASASCSSNAASTPVASGSGGSSSVASDVELEENEDEEEEEEEEEEVVVVPRIRKLPLRERRALRVSERKLKKERVQEERERVRVGQRRSRRLNADSPLPSSSLGLRGSRRSDRMNNNSPSEVLVPEVRELFI